MRCINCPVNRGKALSCLATAVAGCGSGGHTIAGSAPALSKSIVTSSGLTLKLSEDKATVAVGQSVNYTLTVTNTTRAPIVYTPMTNCSSAALVVGTYSSVAVAGPSNSTFQLPPNPDLGCQYVSAGPPVTLAPGASIEGIVSSSALTEKGNYSATGNIAISLGDFDPGTTQSQSLNVGSLPLVVD